MQLTINCGDEGTSVDIHCQQEFDIDYQQGFSRRSQNFPCSEWMFGRAELLGSEAEVHNRTGGPCGPPIHHAIFPGESERSINPA
jgi:hypothetical protein